MGNLSCVHGDDRKRSLVSSQLERKKKKKNLKGGRELGRRKSTGYSVKKTPITDY